jgi:hypothetical protein
MELILHSIIKSIEKPEIPNPHDADKYPSMVVYNIQGITHG